MISGKLLGDVLWVVAGVGYLTTAWWQHRSTSGRISAWRPPPGPWWLRAPAAAGAGLTAIGGVLRGDWPFGVCVLAVTLILYEGIHWSHNRRVKPRNQDPAPLPDQPAGR